MTKQSNIKQDLIFSREDESDDAEFYSDRRFEIQLDSFALSTIELLISQLIIEDNPVILDLMAGSNSHISGTIHPEKVVGLGLNKTELTGNQVLTEHIIHDLNRNPVLPLETNTFDAVICSISVDYVMFPVKVFKEVGRILKPGGVFMVNFTNRFFPQKTVKIWRETTEEDHVFLVRDFFRQTQLFEEPEIFISRGFPRPEDDKYAYLNIPSDPIYSIYANRTGKPVQRPFPDLKLYDPSYDKDEVQKRKSEVKNSMSCPYCNTRLTKWEVPQTPFTQWPNKYLYICFNDRCSYFVRGWNVMILQDKLCSYRLSYDPESNGCRPIPVLTEKALRESIIEE